MSDSDLPGEPRSAWLATTPGTDYGPLEGDRRVDVAVVGGGIAGLSTATRLREAGKTVALLERDRIVSGVTAKTTAKVTAQHGLVYDHLREEFGREQARQYARVNEAAIETMADRVDERGIDCEFERQPAYLYARDSGMRETIRRETEAARAAGIDASFVESIPLPFEVDCAVRFDDEAQFHPRKYLLALADDLDADDGADVHERTKVTDVEPGSPVRVETERGTVAADHAVLATHFPILDRAGYFARQHPSRSYVVAVRLEGDPPEGMHYKPDEPTRSVRTYRDDEDALVLLSGEGHKTGHGGETAEHYRRLYDWGRERFDVAEAAYRWSTQDYEPVDRVPFVGRAGVGTGNVYVATGFRKWGMTTATVAADLLTDLIRGRKPPERELFDPLRFTPRASAKEFATENAEAAGRLVADWLETPLRSSKEPLAPGDGTVLRRGPEPIAVSRDDDGTVHAVSAICTHMHCVVQWNDAERSWDCPCHGSRFDPDGEVLDGPANEPLPGRGVGGGTTDADPE